MNATKIVEKFKAIEPEYIGAGVTRSVFRVDDFVVKVPSADGINDEANLIEHETYLNLLAWYPDRTLPNGWRFPKTELIDGLVVMEYIDGEAYSTVLSSTLGYTMERWDVDDEMVEQGLSFGIEDTHPGNFVVDHEGTFWLIDLGCG